MIAEACRKTPLNLSERDNAEEKLLDDPLDRHRNDIVAQLSTYATHLL